MLSAGEHAGEIETEAVDAVGINPIFEAMHNETADQGMVAIHRIAATGEVEVTLAVTCIEVIKDIVAKPAETDDRTILAALRRMVENHVQ